MHFTICISISRSKAQSAVGPETAIRNSPPPPPERWGTGSAANRQQVTSCMRQALCLVCFHGLCGHEGDTVLPSHFTDEEADLLKVTQLGKHPDS